MADPPRPSGVWRVAALAAVVGVLAGCGAQGGQSPSRQVATVAQRYEQALLSDNGRAACSLMSAQVRGVFGRSLTACTQAIALLAPGGRVTASVTAVRIRGTQATATLRSTAGVSTLPLSREAGRWRVAGRVHYIVRNWLQVDYRLTHADRLSASSVAGILERRAGRIIGALVHVQAIGSHEVRVAVAEPARLSDLARVTRRDVGRLAFYDWETNALTPSGRTVSQALREQDATAMLISQGSGTQPPGATGGLPLRAAVKLAAKQRAVAGARPSQPTFPGVPPGWMVIAGETPDAQYFVLRDHPALSRSDVADAYETVDARGRPAIAIRFTPDGGRAFHRLSAEIARRGAALSTPQLSLNQHLATVLDGKLVSVIYVDYHVYPHGIPTPDGSDIAGGFSPLSAYRLANLISAPPLPVDLQLLSTTTVTRRVTPGSDLPAGATTAPRQPAGPA